MTKLLLLNLILQTISYDHISFISNSDIKVYLFYFDSLINLINV